jgi:hypothetical protein
MTTHAPDDNRATSPTTGELPRPRVAEPHFETGAGQAATEPRAKFPPWAIVLAAMGGVIIILLVVLAGLVVSGALRGSQPAPPAPAAPTATASPSTGSTIQLVVVSSEKTVGSISYGDAGTYSSTTGQTAPWTLSYQLNPGYSYPNVTASLQGASNGAWVACQIRRDGQPIAQQSGQGQYASATCAVRAQ